MYIMIYIISHSKNKFCFPFSEPSLFAKYDKFTLSFIKEKKFSFSFRYKKKSLTYMLKNNRKGAHIECLFRFDLFLVCWLHFSSQVDLSASQWMRHSDCFLLHVFSPIYKQNIVNIITVLQRIIFETKQHVLLIGT